MFAKSIVTKGGDVFRDEFSVAFDGSNDYVETSFIPDYISTNATTAFWIKMANFSGTQRMGQHRNKRWYHGFDGSNINIGVANTHNGSSPITPSPALVAGQWIHYCVTAIDGTATVYINGVAQGTMSYTQSSGTDPDTGYFIGAQDDASGVTTQMECNISEVVHYNVGLTANQVKTIYNGREPYNHKEGVASGNLQAWHRMGDGALDNYELICDETNATFQNKVTNGTFDADSDWTKGTGWTIGSGTANGSSVSGSYLEQDVSAVAGKIYKVSFDVTAYTTGALFCDIGGSGFSFIVGAGHFSNYFKAANTNNLRIYSLGGPGTFTGSIDNVKALEIGGNAGWMTNMSADDIEGDTP